MDCDLRWSANNANESVAFVAFDLLVACYFVPLLWMASRE